MRGGISDKPITKSQVRAIHAARRRLGMEDPEYRALMVGLFHVASCRELTRRQANELLTKLGVPLRNPPGGRKRPPAERPPRLPAEVTRFVTVPQRQLIEVLAAEVNWRLPAHKAFPAWLRNNMGIERVATSDQAVAVIEGLKALRRKTNHA